MANDKFGISNNWKIGIVVGFIACGLGIALTCGLILGLPVKNAHKNIALLQESLLNTRIALDETFMELATNITNSGGGLELIEDVIQSGTYRFQDFATGDFSGLPYTLSDYQIGPLRFTVLKIPPIPAYTLDLQYAPDLYVDFNSFSPPLSTLANYDSPTTSLILPISNANVKRFNLPCITANTCKPVSSFSNFFGFRNNAISMTIFPVGAPENGFLFTWTETLMIMFPAA